MSISFNLRPARQNLLSFVNIVSVAISLRCNAFIAVMQSAKLRNLNDSPATHYLPRNWTLLAQSQMRSGFMIVAEVVSQYPLQMFAGEAAEECGRRCARIWRCRPF